MKKFLSILLVLSMAFSAAACARVDVASDKHLFSAKQADGQAISNMTNLSASAATGESDGKMVYYEDFNDLSSDLSHVEILEALGWKALYNSPICVPVGHEKVSEVGNRTNPTAIMSVSGGRLYINNNVASPVESIFKILPEDYMQVCGNGDYTIQYDLKFDTFNSPNSYVSAAPHFSYDFDTNSHTFPMVIIRGTGRMNHEMRVNNGATGGGHMNVNNSSAISANQTTAANGWWVTRILNGMSDAVYDSTATTNLLADKEFTVTIKMVKQNSDWSDTISRSELGDISKMSESKLTTAESETLTWGYHIYINGILVSRFNPENANAHYWNELTANTFGFYFGAGTAVYLDNLAIWTGLDGMPTNTSTAAYEALVTREPTPGKDGMMVYYEDFNGLTSDMSHADILEELSWKALYNSASSIPANLTDLAEVGERKNPTAIFSASNGSLYVNNNVSSAAESIFKILTDEYMASCAAGDYTISYDMVFDTFNNANAYVSAAPHFSYDATTNSHTFPMVIIRATGRMNHELRVNNGATGGGHKNVNNSSAISANQTSAANAWWVTRIFGELSNATYDSTATTNLITGQNINVTIKMVKRTSSWSDAIDRAELGDISKVNASRLTTAETEKLTWGYHIYINGVLASRFNTENENAQYWNELTSDTFGFFFGANTAVYLDNLAIWTGLGDMPEDTTTTAYENHIAGIVTPEPEPETQPDVVDPDETGIVIVKNDTARLYVVIPENADRNVLYAKDKLVHKVEALTGVTLSSGTDTDHAYELIIGNTGRAESVALAQTLSDGEYAIKVVGNKIVIVADEDVFLYDAVDHFINTYITDEYASITENRIVLNSVIDVKGVGDTTSLRYLFTQSQTLSSDNNLKFNVPYPSSTIKATQGGGTDGTYFYQAFIQRDNTSDEANNVVKIGKFDMLTGEAITYSGNLTLNHSNDITYNTKTGQLVVCHNNPNHSRLTIIDPVTLTVVRVVDLPCNIYSITYSPERDMYMVGCSGGQNIRYITSDFKLASNEVFKATPLTSDYTTQGICSDENFIYCVLWDGARSTTEDFQNVITVYDWYGNFVGIIEFNVGVLEPENIIVNDGQISVLCYYSSIGGKLFNIFPKVE